MAISGKGETIKVCKDDSFDMIIYGFVNDMGFDSDRTYKESTIRYFKKTIRRNIDDAWGIEQNYAEIARMFGVAV